MNTNYEISKICINEEKKSIYMEMEYTKSEKEANEIFSKMIENNKNIIYATIKKNTQKNSKVIKSYVKKKKEV